MKKKLNCVELLAVYLAERSVKKSIPFIMHKVCKPDNLSHMINEMRMEYSEIYQKNE